MGRVESRLRELLEEVLETLRVSPDPFRVRVREILDELSRLLPEAGLEDMPLDAEILFRLAEVVRRQGEWIMGEAGAMALGRLFALLKVKLLNNHELALQLLESWRPIVELEQVTFTEIMRALDYLGSRRRRALAVEEGWELRAISREEMAALGVLSKRKLSEVLDKVRRRLLHMLSAQDVVRYWEAVKGADRYETYLNAYALSHLASLGEFEVIYDPLEDEYYVTRGVEGGEPVSVVVPLGLVKYDAS
ncbi:MAG: hypothetical protein DRK00_02640 [Thermoprotei archaeon]|nr:MAG: hypothetical protein DRK00_02640 [Thermoprotei archaeon]